MMDHDKRIDKSVEFVSVNIAILTVSDSRKATDDRSGDLLLNALIGMGITWLEGLL